MINEPVLKKKNLIDRILKNQLFVTITTSMLLVFIVVGSSYAIFKQDEVKLGNDVIVQSGEMETTIRSTNETITLNYDTLGVSDEVGMAGPTYTFEVENTGSTKIAYYEVRIVDKEYAISTLPHKSLNYAIKVNNNEYTSPSNLGDYDSYIYFGNELNPGEKDTFNLKLWVNEKWGKYANNKELRASIEVTLYNENITRDYILYDTNGGSGFIPKTSVLSKKISMLKPKKQGYGFLGWSTSPNAKEVEYTIGSIYKGNSGMILYAVWKEAEVAVPLIKSKLGVDGLVAINTNGELANDGDTIREYRYSGNARYCTYTNSGTTYTLNVGSYESTCPKACLTYGFILHKTSDYITNGVSCDTELTANEIVPNEGPVKNYIRYNNELWRIIGVFNETVKEETTGSETNQEVIKIIKDTPISADALTGTDYTYNGTTMKLRSTGKTSPYSYFCWNYSKYFSQTNENDWTKAALQYYLNDESGANSYYNSIEASERERIVTVKYYLGNVAYRNNPANTAYTEERGTNIWSGNSTYWYGKIGLMYPSDYGYAADSDNWTTDIGDYGELSKTASQKNWLRDEAYYVEWSMSPSANYTSRAMTVYPDGTVFNEDVDNLGVASPVLYLKSETTIGEGSGAYNDPYILS